MKNHHKEIPSPEPAGLTERWITPPTGGGACPFTGLKHSKFYAEFCGNESIRQVRTGAGERRGKRLLWLPDIYSYLMAKAEADRGNSGSN